MNEELFIGELLNYESARLKKSQYLSFDFIYNPDLKAIAMELCGSDFSFEKLYIKHGRKIAIYAMELADNYLKYKLNRTGNLGHGRWRGILFVIQSIGIKSTKNTERLSEISRKFTYKK